MIMLTILAMTMIVFISRYLFLEPKLPVRLNTRIQRFLTFSSPAVLTALWAPIVFIPEGELSLSFTNPYLIAAMLAAAVAYVTKNVLLTVVVSLAAFFILRLLGMQ